MLEPKPVEGAASPVPSAPLGSALSGSLPCIGCGYELRGLSIRSVCPECGIAVRATILYKVDPHAEEFQPLFTPRLTALSLVVWPVAALVACLASWSERLADVAEVLSGRAAILPAWVGTVELYAAAISGVALVGLVRPARSLAWWKSLAVIGALAAYVPLLWCIARINNLDAVRPVPYFSSTLHLDRIGLHMLLTICTGFILAAVRPVARDLVRRSLAMRMGRVDRQTLLLMVGVCGLVLVGNALRWFAGTADAPQALAVGTLIVAAGSLFLTLGIASGVVDGWRIGQAIRSPAPGIRQIVGSE
ncbi:MAG: hypothetical protein ACKVZJ_14685 [Phycisphaerales bacterium]